jgi:hypothetical protein
MYRYIIAYPGRTPKYFFKMLGKQICASRTFTHSSSNSIDSTGEERQSNGSATSVTTQDIALFLKYNRSSKQKFFNIFPFIVSKNNLVSAWLEVKSSTDALTTMRDEKLTILTLFCTMNLSTKI